MHYGPFYTCSSTVATSQGGATYDRLVKLRYPKHIPDYFENKKHLKNVGQIRHCEPPHAHSPGIASGTVARRLCIDVHDNNDNDDDNDNA